MDLIIENARQVIACNTGGGRFLSGIHQQELSLCENTSIYVENGLIAFIGKKVPKGLISKAHKKIDARNKVIMPGFIDSHTHLVFAGDRVNEYSMRLQGKTYEQISKAGGGIVNTVSAVRKASKENLIKIALKRIGRFIEFGVTTLEAKSGYGLDTKNEMKMLEIIKELNEKSKIEILPTFLGAHAVPKEMTKKDYIDLIIYEMIPLVMEKKLAKYIDVFCEKNYFTAEETDKIFKQGIKFGFIPKLHTNQFNSIGGIETAIRNKAISVEHLEVLTNKEIKLLQGKEIVACVLPGVSYFLDIHFAPARKMIDNGVPVAISTDFNPGSCMSENIQLMMSLAVHEMKMTIEETINAVTINAAAALGISKEKGSIEIGKQADLLIFDMPDYRHLIYHFGVNVIEKVIKRGKIIYEK
jgi:imidazolonepropionase